MTRPTFLSLLTASCVVLAGPALAQTGSGASGGGGRTGAGTPQQPRVASVAEVERQTPEGFSVVLVLGDLQGGAVSDNVPPAARKALADMKDFLPYKGYRLLDVQWTLCCSRGPSTSVVSRLRGADGQEYELSLATSVDPRHRLGVRFLLREAGGQLTTASTSAVPAEVILQREISRLEQQLETTRHKAQQRHEVGAAGPAEEDRGVQELRGRLAEMRVKLAETRNEQRTSGQSRSAKVSGNPPVIDTSFTMDVGETVVVGTSRVAGGDKALIALLTAVSKKR